MHGDYLTVVGLVLEYLEVGGRTLSPVVLVGGMLNVGIQMAAMVDSSLVDHIHQFDHMCPCHLYYCAVAFSVCQGTILVFYVLVVFQLA